MAEQNTSARERKKNSLRKQLIHTDADTYIKEKKKRRKNGIIAVGVLAVFLVLAAVLYGMYQNNRTFEDYEVQWSKENSKEGYEDYVELAEGILLVGRNDASFMDKQGEIVWTKSYEMQNPDVVTCKNYAAIVDRKAKTIVICNEKGSQGTVETSLPITRCTVSASGVVAAILEDKDASYICFYDKTGTKLEVEIKTVLSGDGYPVDLDLSPDGQQLLVSYVTVDEGEMGNQLVFYNFAEGKDSVNRIVGGFKQTDSLVGKVYFLNNESAAVIADNKVSFYSTENRLSPKLVKELNVEEEILSVVSGGNYVGIVADLENDDTGEDRILTIFNEKGEISFQKEFSFGYDEIHFAGNEIIMYNASKCYIYRLTGKLRFDGGFESSMQKVLRIGDGEYLFVSSALTEAVKLK